MSYSHTGYSGAAYSSSVGAVGSGADKGTGTFGVTLSFTAEAKSRSAGDFGDGHNMVMLFECDASLLVGVGTGVKTKPSLWTPEDPASDTWSEQNPIVGE